MVSEPTGPEYGAHNETAEPDGGTTEVVTPTAPAEAAAAAPVVAPARRRRAWLTELLWVLVAGVVSTVGGVLALRISFTDLALRWQTGGDDQILHYTLFTSATQAFPFSANGALGFPDGMNGFFTAQYDLATVGALTVLSTVLRDGFVLLNVFYVLTFFTTAVTGYAFFRALKVRPWVSAFVAIVFSLAPYHFMRIGMGHAFLANYWAIPLIGILALMVAGDRTDPFAGFAARAAGPAGRFLRRAVPGVVIALLIATTGGYYFVFAVIVVAGVWLLATLGHLFSRGRLVELVQPTIPLLALVGFVGIELKLLAANFGERYAPYYSGRIEAESEYYAGKLMSLLLPWAGSDVPVLRGWSERYVAQTGVLQTTEPTGMPLLASIGFVLLVFVLPVLALSGGRALRATAIGRLFSDARTRVLATATLWTFFFFIVTGLGMAVAMIAGPTIRAWSRLSIVIILLSLGFIALVIDRITAKFGTRYIVVGLLSVLVVFDQILGVAAQVPLAPTPDEDMSEFVAQADAELPDGCGVVQLPIKSFPDSGRIGNLNDYDEALPYLYTDSGRLDWSYGSVEGTYGFDVWDDATTPAGFADAVQETGACAIYVDTNGYTEDPEGWLPFVEAADATEIVTSDSGRYLMYEVAG